MNGVAAVIDILRTNAGVQAYIGSGTSARVWPIDRPQGSTLPAIEVSLTDSSPSDTKDGVSTLDQDNIAVHYYAYSYPTVAELAEAGRTAMDRTSGTYNGVTVQSIRFESPDEWVDQIDSKQIYVIEHNYKVRIVR